MKVSKVKAEMEVKRRITIRKFVRRGKDERDHGKRIQLDEANGVGVKMKTNKQAIEREGYYYWRKECI